MNIKPYRGITNLHGKNLPEFMDVKTFFPQREDEKTLPKLTDYEYGCAIISPLVNKKMAIKIVSDGKR